MPYCSKCGKQISESAKFCTSCGAPVKPVDDNTKRQSVYEGKIHKCPNCGQIVEAFQDDCPACGYQFRDTTVTSSVKELADKLQQISNQNIPYSEKNIRKASLINNFVIPNTFEDLWEFLILSSSNIQEITEPITPDKKDLSKAWNAKFEQAYLKAKLVIDNPQKIQQIEQLYATKHKEINLNDERRRRLFKYTAIITGLLWAGLILSLILGILNDDSYSHEIDSENRRLSSIVTEIYECIDSKDYTSARTKAVTLTFNYFSDKTESDDIARQQWDETRENLLKIIDEAEQKAKAQTNMEGE